jgi:sigma-B regulation protein RsbU (phosphoserine phosphatase)
MDVSPHVLVVDDEESVRTVLGSLLEACGFTAFRAEDGYQALWMLESCQPEIVFTDLNMPGMKGHVLIAKLKERIPDTPIVVVSGISDMRSAIEAIRLGAWEYVIKPVELATLQHVTNRIQERARLIRENRAYQERLEELVVERTHDLRDSEMRYRTLFEAANDGIILIQSGLIESCNKRAAEMLGCPAEDIRNHSLFDFAPERQPDGGSSAEIYARNQQLALQGKAQFFEWSYGCADIRLEAEISLSRLDLHGLPYILAIVRDITERKKAEAALLENARIKRELDMAREIQRSLLPAAPPSVPGIRIACRCIPATSVGGDYYDFFTIDAGVTDIVIADVAGHSLGSALLMAEARTILRAKVRAERHPALLLSAMNELLYDDLSRAGLQMSAFAVRLDAATRTLRYANAGHTRSLLFRNASSEVVELDAEGMLLGVTRDVEFEEECCSLSSGDLLLLLTDGVIEAENSHGDFYGSERLGALLSLRREAEVEDIVAGIIRDLNAFADTQPHRDDITLVAVSVE